MVLLNKAALSSFDFNAPMSLLFFQCVVCVILVYFSALFGKTPSCEFICLDIFFGAEASCYDMLHNLVSYPPVDLWNLLRLSKQ